MSRNDSQIRQLDPADMLGTEAENRRIRRRGWIVTFMLMTFMLINFADKSAVSLAGVEIKTDLGLSNEQFGLAQSAFFWLFAIGAVTLGSLGGRVSARWLLAGLVGLWVISMIPLTAPIGFGMFVACRILLGFAEGPAGALSQQIAHTWFAPERRSLPASVVIMGASLGPLIAAPVITWIIQSYDWHAAFMVLAVCGVVWIVAWLFLGGEGPAGKLGTASSGDTSKAVVLPDTAPLRLLWTRPTVIGVAVFSFCSYWATALKVSWLPVYLREGLGYSAGATGLLITLPFAAAVVLTFLAGLISTRMSLAGRSSRTARAIFAAGLLAVGGACMIVFTVLPVGWFQMVLITLAFSLNTAAWGLAFSLLSDVVPTRQRGSVMSMTVAIYSLGGVAAPLLIGGLVSGGGSGYGTGFVIVGVIMLIGALTAALAVNPERDATVVAAYRPAGEGASPDRETASR